MTTAVCPYCRAPIDSATEEVRLCEGCETPHHRDCFEENRGCTVFGCTSAPAEEPKVHVSSPDLSGVGTSMTPAASILPGSLQAAPSAPATFGGYSAVDPDPALRYKDKTTFIILGVLLGALGVHNFYAGYKKKGVFQLCLTVLTLGYGAPMSWVWAVIDICTIETDNNGVQFRS